MTTYLYQWGIIHDPQTDKRIKCNVPMRMPINQRSEGNFIQVTCGTNYTLVLDANNRVFVIGDEPKNGRLGQGDDQTIVPSLSLIKGKIPPISFISSGPSTSILLTTDRRELWGFGKGIGYVAQPILVSDQTITHCTCGEHTMIVVINNRQIKERRYNRDGFTTDWICIYELSDMNDSIRNIDMGVSLNGFVTEQGHVYLWGSTVPVGKVSKDENYRNVSIDEALQRDLPDTNDRPIQISCSRGQFHAHVLLLTEQGCIYSMGSNYKVKLGVDNDIPFTGQWTLIELTRQCPFKMIATGGIHSSALSVDGRVFTWGCGSDGRLGHSEAQGHRYLYKENEPRPIETFNKQRVICVGTSYYHMAAIVAH